MAAADASLYLCFCFAVQADVFSSCSVHITCTLPIYLECCGHKHTIHSVCMLLHVYLLYAIFIRIRVTGRCCSGSYSTVSHIGELLKNVTIFKQAHRDIFLCISGKHFCFKSVAHPKMTSVIIHFIKHEGK